MTTPNPHPLPADSPADLAAEREKRYNFLLGFLIERGVLTDKRYHNGTWSLQGIYGVDDSGLRGAGLTPEEAIDNAIVMANLDPEAARKFWTNTHAVLATIQASASASQEPVALPEPAWMSAFDEARDAILNDRGPLEGESPSNYQTNAVLAILDDAFMPHLKRGPITCENIAARIGSVALRLGKDNAYRHRAAEELLGICSALAATQAQQVGMLRITQWPIGREWHFEPIEDLRVLPVGEHPVCIVAATQARPASGGAWQPIETAPKDGTAILLGARGGSWIGYWHPIYQSGYRPDNPWSSLMLNHDHMGEKWLKPTHWMPLPQLPKD